MLRKGHILAISVLIVSVSITSISAQSQADIPAWVKGVANFWVEGNISDGEFGESISFLIEQNIIQVEMPETDDFQKIDTIRNLVVENKKLEAENKILKRGLEFYKQENAELKTKLGIIETGISSYLDDLESTSYECPSSHPYEWSDGLCYDLPEYYYDEPVDTTPSCDPSYPDVCIPPYPPDLDCGEIGYSNFRVVGSDPHGFDRDNDGIGCES